MVIKVGTKLRPKKPTEWTAGVWEVDSIACYGPPWRTILSIVQDGKHDGVRIDYLIEDWEVA